VGAEKNDLFSVHITPMPPKLQVKVLRNYHVQVMFYAASQAPNRHRAVIHDSQGRDHHQVTGHLDVVFLLTNCSLFSTSTASKATSHSKYQTAEPSPRLGKQLTQTKKFRPRQTNCLTLYHANTGLCAHIISLHSNTQPNSTSTSNRNRHT